MNVEYHGDDENREIKKFNLALSKAKLMKLWDNRFFNVFVNGTQIFSFPANTEYFLLEDNAIYLRVLATSNLFRIKGNFEEIAFKISNDENNVKTEFKINHVEVCELKNVGIGVPIIGMRFNLA